VEESARTETLDDALASLASYPERILGRPAALEIGKRIWGPGRATCSLGTPMRFEAAELGRWVGPHDVVCELRRLPQDGRTQIALLFPSSDGARWVDRILGGEGQITHAHALSEAELGVLAYALARGLTELLPGFQLASIEACQPEQLGAHYPSGVVWPLALHTPLGDVDLRLVLSDHAVAQTPLEADVQVLLRDSCESECSLADCEPGDVLLSDALAVAVTSTGLMGPVEVRFRGLQGSLPANLAGHTLHLRRGRTPDTSAPPRSRNVDAQLEFVIAKRRVSLLEIAEFARGAPLHLQDIPLASVSVLQDGKQRAEGSLVVHRGALGVRMTRLV
jgi:hypothetical protein